MTEQPDEYLDAERPAVVEEELDPEAPADAKPSAVPDSEREEPDLDSPAAPRDVLESEPNVGTHGLAGGMGVSSERVGPVRGDAEPRSTGAESLDSPDPSHG